MSNTPNWTGAWSIVTSYNLYDLVSYQGSTWIATAANTGSQPGTTASWTLFAAAGQNGINAWKGTWSSTTSYTAFNAVSYNNASYISLVNSNYGNIPSSSPSQWAALAEAGGPGPAGDFTFTGVWSSTASYVLNDIVSYLGSSYVVTNAATVGVNPALDAGNWMLIASVGAAGPTGPQGVQGAQGLGFTWQGAWSSTAIYHANDVVGLLGSSYVAVATSVGVNPSTDNGSNWQIIAVAGTNGTNVLVLQTNGVGNTIQTKQNIIGTGGITAVSDAFGNVTLTGVIQRATITLSGSQIANLNTTPIQVLPAPGAGLIYNIVSTFWSYTYGTQPFTVTPNDGSGFLSVGVGTSTLYYSAVSLGDVSDDPGIPLLDLTETASQTLMGGPPYGGDVATNCVNQPMNIIVSGNTIGGTGDGTLKVVVYYTIEAA